MTTGDIGKAVEHAFTAFATSLGEDVENIADQVQRHASAHGRCFDEVFGRTIIEVQDRVARFRDNYVRVLDGGLPPEGPRYVAAPDENGCWHVTDTMDGAIIWQAVYPGGEARAGEVAADANAGRLPGDVPAAHDAASCSWFGCLTHHGPEQVTTA